MTALAIDPRTDREAWLEARRSGIGASEAGAALGFSPFCSPRELYLQKIGEAPATEENEAMRWGNLLEPVIAREYERVTGNRIAAQQVFLREEIGGVPLLATLDGVVSDEHLVEIKTTSTWGGREIGEADDDLPEHWLLQAQQQMRVAGAERVDFAILIAGQRLVVKTVERNDHIIANLIPRLGEFWGRVQRREPPPYGHVQDRRLMHLIYPGCDGEVDLGNDLAEVVDRYQRLGETERQARSDRDALKAAILDRMGNAAIGRLPDGRVVTRKITTVAEQVVARKAYTFVDMRIRKGGRS
jgi:putative phage-type endonuclease